MGKACGRLGSWSEGQGQKVCVFKESQILGERECRWDGRGKVGATNQGSPLRLR